MQKEKEIELLLNRERIPYRKGEPMKDHTSFHIGGGAAFFVTPRTEEELRKIICEVKPLAPLFFLGRGSNLLVSDQGLDAVVVEIGKEFSDITFPEEDSILVSAGASLLRLCAEAKERGLTGLEFAYGIPGSVGGAVYMNAGAFNGEMKDVVEYVDYLDGDGVLHRIEGEALGFGYRKSFFTGTDFCILRAKIRLQKGNREEIEQKMEELLARRKLKQPLEYPSAGSTFKRPEGAYAGALIEQSGLKGRLVGGAMVSEKHANFLINYDHATCADMRALIRLVQQEVKEKTGYQLECEVLFLGE